jgi:hypothetical protein
MNDEAQISETEARANFQKWKDILNGLKKNKTNRKDQAVKLANELSSFTENIFAAQKAYIDKGFEVTIETSPETGLVTKWKLKNKYPKRIRVGGGGINKVAANKAMSVQEFNSIVNLLGDGELSSKDIQDALTKGGIGARKLQPTLGLILKGMYGEPLIEKANEDTRGPGVRYRKVK